MRLIFNKHIKFNQLIIIIQIIVNFLNKCLYDILSRM